MKKKIFLILFFSFLTVIFIFTHKVFSLECDQVSDLQQKISCLDQKRNQLHQQARTLTSEIQYMNTQIDLTTLQIQQTEQKILTTQKEIELLGTRIEGLDNSLDYLSKLLLNKIIQGYKNRSLSIFTVILDSASAEDFFSRVKYLKTTQENNQKLLIQVQETKANFEEQKKLREEKKVELADLEKTLINQKRDLNYQKSQKQVLLTETQNNEAVYQQLLAQALAEFNAIQQAIATGSKIGPVKKGDPIGLVGNSGAPYCSTGPHLHFEVRVNNSWVNAENYLSPKSVKDDQSSGMQTIGTGGWDWPLQDPVEVTQRYGKTPWSWRYTYSGGVHTGVDMVSDSTEVIRAPADGTLYSSAQNCSGSIINIKYIDHGDGLLSFYLHVQQ